MSEDNKLPMEEPKTDLTQEELEKVRQYEEKGLPGISEITSSQLAQMMDLYLSGKTYRFISSTLSVKVVKIMYLSKKFGWYEARQSYLMDIERNMKTRLAEARVESQDFLLQLAQLWQRKIGKKISTYLATGDEAHADKIDLKEIDRYLKTIDILQKINEIPGQSGNKGPAVGLHVGDGVSIKKINENEVEITPRQKAIEDVLKHYANLRREEDKNRLNIKEAKEIKDTKGEKNET
jgi:hypothetical protein